MGSGDDELRSCTCRPSPPARSRSSEARPSLETRELRSSVDRNHKSLHLVLRLLVVCFLSPAKAKSSGSSSISQIYTSLWKPWSYLTGTASTDGTGATTQQMATITGLEFVEPADYSGSVANHHRRASSVAFCKCSLTESSDSRDGSPSNWTGPVDLEEESSAGYSDAGSFTWPMFAALIIKRHRLTRVVCVNPLLRPRPLVLRVLGCFCEPAARPWTELGLGRSSGVWSRLRGVPPTACRCDSCREEGQFGGRVHFKGPSELQSGGGFRVPDPLCSFCNSALLSCEIFSSDPTVYRLPT